MRKADMSLPPEEFLLSVINNKYDKNFTFDDFYFKEREDTDAYDCDSVIVMQANPNGRYSGSIKAYYDRVQLDEFLEDTPLRVKWKEFHMTDDLLDEVLIQLGINLPRMDIISRVINVDEPCGEIIISNKSLTYRGSIPVFFSDHPDTLYGRVLNTTLKGF